MSQMVRIKNEKSIFIIFIFIFVCVSVNMETHYNRFHRLNVLHILLCRVQLWGYQRVFQRYEVERRDHHFHDTYKKTYNFHEFFSNQTA